VPSSPPSGEPPPADGVLPPASLAAVGKSPLGIYVHVPFCAARCGYCDFNTYVDLPNLQRGFADVANEEIRLARHVLGAQAPRISTVFFGGGTPTLLPPEDLGRVLRTIVDEFGLAPDAEVTTEANPETVDPTSLRALRACGFTRISFGMQSAVPHVLAALDRVHAQGRPEECVAEAKLARFEHTSLDLIYGTPGESLDDWRRSVTAAIDAEPDHVSAYALVVEPGTQMAARVARGELAPPDDDDLAEKYVIADELLTAAGYEWYEVSNWARPRGECRHNLGYWRNADWWGVGPGAHSHVAGTRWWNVRHPATYAARLGHGASPAEAVEHPSADERRLEQVMLGLRLREGLALPTLTEAGRRAATAAISRGLLARDGDVVRLTRTGRLLADALVRDLSD
jgi:oxygen-independent coproporphyrinogen-3 oxidase